MTGDNRKPRADGLRQPAKPKQVSQHVQQSQAKAAAHADQRAASERRPTLHLKGYADGRTSGLEPNRPSPKPG
jgi:hypothetical protein